MEDKRKSTAPDTSAGDFHPLLILRDLARHLWLIVAAAMLAASFGYVISSMAYSPKYRTTTAFVVTSRTSSANPFSNLSSTKSMADSFSKILGSDVMRKYVAQDLGVDRVNGEIRASAVEETNIIELYVTADNQRDAYLITRSLLNNYEKLTGKLLDSITLEILKGPVVPTAPINSSDAVRISKLAALAAAVLAAAYVCARAYLRDTVKTVDELERKLDAKLLASVQHETKHKTVKDALSRKKTSILITNPTTGFVFVETFKKLRTKVDYSVRREGCRVIMVTSVLEDEGKSTVAANLALAMGRKYRNVLLVDADFKKPAIYKILDYQDREFESLSDILEGKAQMSDAVIVDKHRKIMSVVNRKAIRYSEELTSSSKLRSFIEESSKNLDVIIIDTPPMMAGPDAECIADLADAAVLVVRQDQAPVFLINDSIDAINRSKAKLLGCVFNNVYSADFNDSYSYGYGGKYGYGYGKYGYGYGRRKNSKDENLEAGE